MNKFITIEGIDGSGKSTYIPKIKKILEDLGQKVVLTREPGGTPFAEVLRGYILNQKMDKMTETLLAFAARKEHVKEIILPNLEKGCFVISDRFIDSTYAYQGYAEGVPLEFIENLEKMVVNDLKPGLTLIFSVPTSVSKERLNKTGKIPDKFESKSKNYFEDVKNGYEERMLKDPSRCKIIDSSLSIEETEKQVKVILEEYLKNIYINKPVKNKM